MPHDRNERWEAFKRRRVTARQTTETLRATQLPSASSGSISKTSQDSEEVREEPPL